jgi:hypothetical protein
MRRNIFKPDEFEVGISRPSARRSRNREGGTGRVEIEWDICPSFVYQNLGHRCGVQQHGWRHQLARSVGNCAGSHLEAVTRLPCNAPDAPRDSSSSSHVIVLLEPSNPRARLYPADLSLPQHERPLSLQISETTKSEFHHSATLLCRLSSRKAYIVSQRCQPTFNFVTGAFHLGTRKCGGLRPIVHREAQPLARI